ncbi:MAG: hypothetical protein ACRDTU_07050 [Micromonosporaceae bacterium]
MEYADFADLAETTVKGLYDRLSADDRRVCDDMLLGGEMQLLVETAVGFLAENHIEVTTAERDTLARLLKHLGEPVSYLDPVPVAADGV